MSSHPGAQKRKRGAEGAKGRAAAASKPALPAAHGSSSQPAKAKETKTAPRPVEAQHSDNDDNESGSSDAAEKSPRELSIFERPTLSLASHPLPPLRQLSSTLSRFSALQRLDMSSMEASEDNPEGLISLDFLARAVTLAQKDAKAASGAAEDLESLNWFGNSLTTLDVRENAGLGKQGEKAWDGLQRLVKLKVLNASHCALLSFPLPSLLPTSLCALILSDNELKSLPNLPLLPNLNTLVLSHNAIEALPKSLPASLPALKKLSLSDNQLRSTREGVKGLPDLTACSHLREVRLNGNAKIEVLPAHMATWGRGVGQDAKGTGLEVLELGDCSLKSWDDVAVLSVSKIEEPSEGDKRRRRGLKNLTLKGNPLASEEGFREKVLAALPDLAVLDGQRLQPKKSKKADPAPAEEDDAMDTSPDAGMDVAEVDRARSRAGPAPGESGVSLKGKRKRDAREEGVEERSKEGTRVKGHHAKQDRPTREADSSKERGKKSKAQLNGRPEKRHADAGEDGESESASATAANGKGKTHRGARGSKKGKKDGGDAVSAAAGIDKPKAKRDAFLVFGDEDGGEGGQKSRPAPLGVTSDSEDEGGIESRKKPKKGKAGAKARENDAPAAAAAAGPSTSGKAETGKKHRRAKRGKGAAGEGEEAGEGDEQRSGGRNGSDWLFAKLASRKGRKREAEGGILESGDGLGETEAGEGEAGAAATKGKTKVGKKDKKDKAGGSKKESKQPLVRGAWDEGSELLPAEAMSKPKKVVPQVSEEVQARESEKEKGKGKPDKAQTSVVGIVDLRKGKGVKERKTSTAMTTAKEGEATTKPTWGVGATSSTWDVGSGAGGAWD